MQAIYVDKQIPRMLLVKAIKPLWRDVVFSPLSPARFAHLPDPPLPGPRWLRVRNRLCGICASDLSLLYVDADPRIGPAALPGNQRFYLGHEVVGVVSEVGAGVQAFRPGDRVIMDTRFQGATCLSQELDTLCPHCQAGNHSLCENASLGRGPRGAGGGWGDSFTAHESELYAIPPDLSDEEAMMVEPMAVAVRTLLKRLPAPGQHVLVLGSGIIGLNVIQAARALAPGCHITAAARYPQQQEMARRLGSQEIVADGDLFAAAARITAAQVYTGLLGSRMALGGFDVIYDCVGSAHSVQQSLRLAKAGGAVVIAGVKLKPMQVDLTPVWYQEVDLIGLYAHGTESWQGQRRRTYDLTIDLIRQGRLRTAGLITHRFPLARWRQAIHTAADKRSGAIKVIFDFTP
ncbi:MAG: alcohol dehydrogenase catalytic domain-containing protein [Caldilineales bacterium]|nr:alcohol dehydrogenase catalytic domain-containing protein [Caldilineales bacterium]